ncbi:hypothetical protein BESB_006530 [Besnoitia besnoiti]|uniref:LITAF domain-containing protein n=1 Tax=Besnoitia besnoiti TaxID=94643 RepID=A0A2A9MQK4_BESBE|nr:hypothetical protein BESB_006530 [Besnoitia besnoiti]PFH38312.1 hypothetical protein BESB_006530 [Besnoitia besnoiti]
MMSAAPIQISSTPVPVPVPEPACSKVHGPPGKRASGLSSSFGDAPVTTSCPHCHKAITTTVAYRHSCLGISICLFVTLLLGWYAFCVVPFLWMGLKDAVHTCPSCRNLINRQSRIQIPLGSLRDEIVTVKCGNCAVVLSRSYFLLFFVISFLILVFYILRAGWLGSALDVIPRGPSITASWRDFYDKCGQKSQLGNPLQAAGNFREHFSGKTVKWEGLVKQIKEGTFSSNFLFVAMYPTMTAEGRGRRGAGGLGGGEPEGDLASLLFGDDKAEGGEDGADARRSPAAPAGDARDDDGKTPEQREEAELLALDEENKGMQGDSADLALAFSEDLNKKVEALVPGDKISFEATLVELGRRGRPSLGRLWDVTVVERWEDRKKRLREKAEDEQRSFFEHLLPSFASPFGGFSPFSLMGSLGGRGVIVVRRQVLTSDPASSLASITQTWQSPRAGEPDGEGDGVVRVVRVVRDDWGGRGGDGVFDGVASGEEEDQRAKGAQGGLERLAEGVGKRDAQNLANKFPHLSGVLELFGDSGGAVNQSARGADDPVLSLGGAAAAHSGGLGFGALADADDGAPQEQGGWEKLLEELRAQRAGAGEPKTPKSGGAAANLFPFLKLGDERADDDDDGAETLKDAKHAETWTDAGKDEADASGLPSEPRPAAGETWKDRAGAGAGAAPSPRASTGEKDATRAEAVWGTREEGGAGQLPPVSAGKASPQRKAPAAQPERARGAAGAKQTEARQRGKKNVVKTERDAAPRSGAASAEKQETAKPGAQTRNTNAQAKREAKRLVSPSIERPASQQKNGDSKLSPKQPQPANTPQG